MTERERARHIVLGLGIVTLLLIGALGATLRARARAERDRDVAVANTAAAQASEIRIEEEGRAAVARLQLQHSADSIAQLVLNTASAALLALNDSLGMQVTALTGMQVTFKARMEEFGQALVEMAEAVTPQGDTVRIAAFTMQQLTAGDSIPSGVEGEMVVEVPKDPNRPIMLTTMLKPTPWDATLQLGCTEDHVASFAVDVPAWVPLTLGLGVVDQDVCLPLPDMSFTGELFRINTSKVVWAGAGGLAVLLLSTLFGN